MYVIAGRQEWFRGPHFENQCLGAVILTIFLTRATLALQNQKESHFYDNMLSHLCKCAFLHINWCYVPDLRGSNKIMLFPGLVSEREDKETCALLKNRSLFYLTKINNNTVRLNSKRWPAKRYQDSQSCNRLTQNTGLQKRTRKPTEQC